MGALLAEASGHSHPTWADFTASTWILLVLVGVGTGWTIWKAVMYTVRPGEDEPDHIKRLILGDALPPEGTLPQELPGVTLTIDKPMSEPHA